MKETNSYSYNTNLVIQAMKELGKENINNDILIKIFKNFNKEELEVIYNEAKNTTIWIYENILRMRGFENEKNC